MFSIQENLVVTVFLEQILLFFLKTSLWRLTVTLKRREVVQTFVLKLFICCRTVRVRYEIKLFHTSPFSKENRAVLLRFQKDLRLHLSFSYRFRPSTLQRLIRFENAFIPSVRMLK